MTKAKNETSQAKKENLQVRSLYHLFSTLAMILLILAGTLGYLHHTIDIEAITQPFNTLSEQAKNEIRNTKGLGDIYEALPVSDTGTGDAFSGLLKKNEEKNKDVTGVEQSQKKQAEREAEQEATGEQDNMAVSLMRKAQAIYIRIRLTMEKFENYIANLPYKPLIVIALMLLFAVKIYVTIVPLSFTCFLSGVIFPFWGALFINLFGILIVFSLKYRQGSKKEKNAIHKYATKWKRLGALIEDSEKGDGTGNPGLLFIFRLAPSVPVNTISSLYGYMGFTFSWYLVISVLGYLIKLITFTAIGCNIDDPFSASFLYPLELILWVSSLAMLIMALIYKRKINVMAEPPETY